MAKPAPTPIVTTAVLDVTVALLVVDDVELGFCGATAVIFTCPLFVLGTTPGAVVDSNLEVGGRRDNRSRCGASTCHAVYLPGDNGARAGGSGRIGEIDGGYELRGAVNRHTRRRRRNRDRRNRTGARAAAARRESQRACDGECKQRWNRSPLLHGEAFPRFWSFGATAATTTNGHTAPCAPLEDICAARVARDRPTPPRAGSG